MLKNRAVLLLKKESSYGTDASPAVSADEILIKDATAVPLGDKILERDVLLPSFSSLPGVLGQTWGQIKFTAAGFHNGTDGASLDIDSALECSGMLKTNTAAATGVEGTDVYDPITTSIPSATIYLYKDGMLYKLLGARGKWSITMEAGKIPEITFEFEGLWQDPVDASLPTPSYDTANPPIFASAGFSIGSYSALISKLSIDFGTVLAARPDPSSGNGVVGIDITGRDVSGSIDPEAVLVATKDFWGIWKAGTTAALTLEIGTTPNKYKITAPAVQEMDISEGDRDSLLTFEIPIKFRMSSGDDEIKITHTNAAAL